MTEQGRKERNTARLKELYPAFAVRIRAVLATMECEGYRPRIQDAYRSPADQLTAYRTGHSKLKFGFHNVTGTNGKAEALAVDILDDDNPLNTGRAFVLRLAGAAKEQGLTTGIRWGLSLAQRRAIDGAIERQEWNAPLKIGWDPTHVEPTGITPAQAKLGKRPN